MQDFAYFQEQDSEQFSFFRIPKVMFSDKRFEELSSEAKILYGVMLDRVGLSRKNGWVDEAGNVYIYFSIDEMMSYLKWTRYKIFQLLDELDSKKGIGLIERKRTGFNKPNVIYVKNFASVLNRNRGAPKIREPDVPKSEQSDLGKSDIQTSGRLTDGLPDVCQADSNNTEKNKTDKNDTEIIFKKNAQGQILYGSFGNVILAERELKELKRRFPYEWKNWIEKLSAYLASTGKYYRSHYATICTWAAREKKPSAEKNYDLPEGKGF